MYANLDRFFWKQICKFKTKQTKKSKIPPYLFRKSFEKSEYPD